MNPEASGIFTVLGALLVGGSLALIAILYLEILKRKRLDESWLVEVKSIKESLIEIAESEINHVEALLSALRKGIGEDILGKDTSFRGELEAFDSKVPGPLRKHYEDLDFLLDLNEFLGGRPSFRDERSLTRAYHYVGILAFKYRQLKKAAKRFEQLLNFDDRALRQVGLSKSQVLKLLGTTYLFLADEVDQEVNLARGIAHLRDSGIPDAITGYNLAWALDEVGNHEGAVLVLHDVIRRDPKLSAAKYNLACALVKLNRFEEAFDALGQVPPGGPLWGTAKQDPELAPLRSDIWKAGFESLLKSKEEVKTAT